MPPASSTATLIVGSGRTDFEGAGEVPSPTGGEITLKATPPGPKRVPLCALVKSIRAGQFSGPRLAQYGESTPVRRSRGAHRRGASRRTRAGKLLGSVESRPGPDEI